MKKRLFAMLLAIILTISLIPSNTLAASNTEAETESTEWNDTASIFCWNQQFLNETTYSEMSSFFRELNISRVYQEIPEEYLMRTETSQAVQRFQEDGFEIVALLGKRAWGLESSDLSEVKTYLDLLETYNQNASVEQKIGKIALDVETYTYSNWKADPVPYFTTYIEKMKEIYEYAHSLNFTVVQVIPVSYDSIDKTLFRQFAETCCDELSLMNYKKSTQISGIEYEIEVCRDLDMPVETIFETMPKNENYSVDESKTYFYDGFEAMQEKRSEILSTYQYSKLSTSYHHFPTMYHVYTGKYLAEIYAYSNSEDPTRDHLGQTYALETLILEGDDGSRIIAGLYNPNRGAEYEECCYLAIGVKPDVTYTVTAGSPEYAVTTGTKTFEFGEGDMVDYTSLRIKRIVPLVCEHSAELRNAKEATCTEEGYTGDSYCTICGERLEKGSVIPMKDHTYQVVSKEDTSHLEACTVCGNTIELSDAASIFCWNRHFLNEITYSEMSSFFRELNISRVYQDIPEAYLSRPETYQAVQRFQKDGMEIVALLGDRSWGLEECDLSEVKTYLDLLDTYNQNASEDQKIHKIALDVETHTYSDWKTDKVAYFTTYIEKMREIYEYAHSLNLSVVQIIPVYFDSIDKPLFRQFVETCCDELSLMNYSKSNQISGIKYEIEVCRDLDMPVETIFETMPSDDAYSVDENITYFYDGFEAMQEKRSEILKTYQYSKLSTSYHHFPTVYHVYTGKYLAEIYAYSNSGDPTRDHLGQTEALKTLILEGDDGSRIVAGLYNPNRGAQYEECCYLAIGVKPDVTYTITAGSPEYTVTTGTKVFEFAEGDMIDFTSLRIKRVEPAVCEHSAELRNAKEATCTEEGYTGDSYCSICSEQLEKGSVIPMKDHTYQVVSKEDGTHCEVCTVCGKTETAEACTDSNEDQICDFCGYVLPKTVAFKEISVPVNGTVFIITKDGKALSAALESISFSPVSVTADQIENSIVWIYDSGYLRCSFDGTEYYLTIDSSNQLSVTTNAAQAAKWTISSDGISTSVSKKLGFIKYSVTYYLNVSDGEFVLNKRKTSMTLYELIR